MTIPAGIIQSTAAMASSSVAGAATISSEFRAVPGQSPPPPCAP